MTFLTARHREILVWSALIFFAVLATWNIYQHPNELLWTPAKANNPYWRSPLGLVANSDQLTHISLIWDLQRSWHNLSGWQFSRAPYLFPDILTYAVIETVVSSFRWSIFLHACLQVTLFAAVSAHLIRRLSGVSILQAAPLAMAGMAMMVVFHAVYTDIFFRTYFLGFFAGNHFSAFLMGLFASALTLSLSETPLSEKPARIRLVVLGGLTLLVTLSNPLLLIDYTIPALIGLVVIGVLEPERLRRHAAIAVVLVAAAAMAIVINRWLPRQPSVDTTFAFSLTWLKEAAGPLARAAINDPWGIGLLFVPAMVVLGLIVPAGTLWFVARLWRTRASEDDGRDADLRLCLFLVIVAVSSPLIIAAYLTTTLGQAENLRYLMPILFYPPILLPLLGAFAVRERARRRPARHPGKRDMGPAAALVAAMLALVLVSRPLVPNILRWDPPEARALLECRDRLGLRAGLSNYWLSRYLMAGTGWRMQVSQVLDIDPKKGYYWGNNLFWFDESLDDPAAPPDYNYVITNRLDEDATIRAFGPPDRREQCGMLTLFIYDRPGLLLDRLVAYSADLPQRAMARGRTVVYDGATLPGTGRIVGNARQAEEGRDKPGALTYGPYIDLPAGRYRLEITYATSPNTGHNALDVASDAGNRILLTQPLPPTGGEERHEIVTLSLPEKVRILEVRSLFDGIGWMRLDRITLSRLGPP